MNYRLSLILPILAAVASPALACGDGSCDPKPDPDPVSNARAIDGEPVQRHVTVQYGYCCQLDGAMRYSAPWGRDSELALEQCRAREKRLEVLPECPARLAARIRREAQK